MPRTLPPPHPRGAPRTPGSGRRRGTPNRRTTEARQLCSDLVHDIRYQAKLRQDFIRRRLHPSIEQMLWHYSVGKPDERIELSGGLTVNQRLIAERAWIRENLDLEAIEALAAESQALIERVMEVARIASPAGEVINVVALKPAGGPVT
jgi:hypothetical protein